MIVSFLAGDENLEDIDDGVNLFDAGIVDSFKMVELVLYMESELGVTIDLFVADPESFFTVVGLCTLFDGAAASIAFRQEQ